jgi:eukaryotic-like serine/threonine-protein kinase
MIGTRLAHYDIVEHLGSGGMGEVYAARDTKLNRLVALKFLPQIFAGDSERLARFQREARVLASLHHPNIATIHSIEEAAEQRFLVMELVDGETLAERLARGPLPLEEARSVATQIAEALDVAHSRGIIHRDLKPANIKIAPVGVVKVLDFGLAKDIQAEAIAELQATTSEGTRVGVILGTAAYMSPEQARGQSADKRSDIWSFGCVLYEMLTGRQAFSGQTFSDTVAAVLQRDPDWTALPASTPLLVRRTIRRCLTRDLAKRARDIGDVRSDLAEIDDALTAPAVPLGEPRPQARRLSIAIWIVAAAIAGSLLAGLGFWFARRPAPTAVTRFTITLPPHLELRGPMALSPDGRTLVYAAIDESGSRLYRRSLDSLEAVPIRGTEGGSAPFFSPDGASLGFSDIRALKRVPLQGGVATIVYQGSRALGATWLPDDTIVFGSQSGLMRIPAAGGEARQMTVVDRGKGEIEHHSPVAVSGGRAVLFTVHTGARDSQRIDVVSLPSGDRAHVTQGSGAKSLPTGQIAFAFQRSGSLWVAPFDEGRLRLAGPPTPVVEGILVSDGWNPTIAAGANGSLAYAIGKASTSYTLRTLFWVDKTGREQPIDAPAHAWWWPEISPDGRRLGFHIMDPANMDAWIYELDHGPLVRVTFNPAQDGYPLWTPDGRRIVFWSSQGGGVRELHVRAADLTGSEERLTTGRNQQSPYSWSGDGKLLVFQQSSPDTGMDIGVVPIDGQQTATMLIHGPEDERHPAVSPDGRWIAYQSNVSGRWEVYVQPFPALGSRWQVSTQGGTSPIWDPRGRELFYRRARTVISVPVAGHGDTFTYGNPRVLFEGPYVNDVFDPGGGPTYALAPDGRRFLMMKEQEAPEGSSGQTQIVVILNWAEELKGRVPAK